MSGTQPVAVYAMKVPAGDVMVPAVPDFAAMFRLSMAAIDPNAVPEFGEGDEKKTPRATLKLIRVPADFFDDDSEDSDYEELEGEEEDEEEESSDGEEVNGGPSDSSRAKKPNKTDLVKAIAEQESEDDEDEEDDSDDEAAAKSALMKIMKGKGKAIGNGDEASDDEEDSLELEEIVICTLDPENVGCGASFPAQGLRLTSTSITSNLSISLSEKMKRSSSRSLAHMRFTLRATMSSQSMTVRLNFTVTMTKVTTTLLPTRTSSMP